MKKIILAFDGTHFSQGAFEFARKLNEIERILLVGVFLPQAEFANLWSYAHVAEHTFIPLIEAQDAEQVQENISKFEKRCRDSGIKCKVHKNFADLALNELEAQSRFADLVILGSEVFFEQMGTNLPNEFLEDALRAVSCPVILVPEKFEFPESIVLAYDGSYNSVFAIKLYYYLFPESRNIKTLLVYAKDGDTSIPEKDQLEELLGGHFNDLRLLKIDSAPGKYLQNWLLERKSSILVCGSYGRSGISQLFKKSFVRDIIAQHKIPVFIAHK
ncbi:MAG: universal stress protein [Bacteroidota bacterium]